MSEPSEGTVDIEEGRRLFDAHRANLSSGPAVNAWTRWARGNASALLARIEASERELRQLQMQPTMTVVPEGTSYERSIQTYHMTAPAWNALHAHLDATVARKRAAEAQCIALRNALAAEDAAIDRVLTLVHEGWKAWQRTETESVGGVEAALGEAFKGLARASLPARALLVEEKDNG